MDARFRAALRKLCGRFPRKDYGGKMKCDELQYERLGEANWAYPASTLVIRKQFVDEAVAELKDIAENACLECDDNQTAIDELEDENRKLKRALWLARAELAKEMCQRLLIQGFDPKWQEVERKCRAKAKEYL